eukprot:763671-Hanusia_phi.AAC.1
MTAARPPVTAAEAGERQNPQRIFPTFVPPDQLPGSTVLTHHSRSPVLQAPGEPSPNRSQDRGTLGPYPPKDTEPQPFEPELGEYRGNFEPCDRGNLESSILQRP